MVQTMSQSLADRLSAARRRHFVGRQQERELLQAALAAADLPFHVLYLFGPGGVGKSSLLREFGYIAEQMGLESILLDGRTIDASPDLFLNTVAALLNISPADVFTALGRRSGRVLMLVDTAELLVPLEGWWQEHFLPQLPDNVLVVIAGRNPPSSRWRADLGWQQLMRVHRLRNLTQEESRAYLMRRQVHSVEHEPVLDFTHGHPLALSLVADLYAQAPETHFQTENVPDVIKTILDQFMQDLPSPAHRTALEAAALVRLTTEPLLAQMLQLDEESTSAIFAWLRQLSFIDTDRYGLYPHDLAREALTADLRWRNSDRYDRLHEQARHFYMRQVSLLAAREQRRLLADYIYLHRDSTMVRPYFEWQSSGTIFTDSLRPSDHPIIFEMVARHEGVASAELAAYWLLRRPQGFIVMRRAGGEPVGFLSLVALEQTDDADREQDPAVAATWAVLQRLSSLQPDETATLFRFWMAPTSYQEVSPAQSRIFLDIVQQYLTTPGLAYSFLPCAEPEFWRDAFFYADLQRISAADFTVGNRSYGVYGHDWRQRPAMTWLTLLGRQKPNPDAQFPVAAASDHVDVGVDVGVDIGVDIGEESFAAAVRQLLRDFPDDNRLRSSPLWQTRLGRQLSHAGATPVDSLRQMVRRMIEPLQHTPRQVKLYRALYHTYLQPAATQEQAAELLNLPFSTYRRHLRGGVDYLVKHLWQLEKPNSNQG